ncbi:putative oxidoreductase [plant metagenome]|uniref:Putative oxidoreductase n=1 Tax=plant metagenome TaxID=1297885 RepID=A0A484Q671_9ZZZZ
MSKIGVGVIGASPLRPGWAVTSHLPAIAALPGYELRAVATSSADSATAAAQAYGVPAFGNAAELIARPDVDLVVVTVKLPYHRELVAAAIAAGKQVMCEWPLGLDLAETQALHQQAQAAGLRTLIGLQARMAPAIRYARDLVAQGYVGDVLATTMIGSGLGWGPVTDRAHAYVYDVANGATTLSVPTMHALDALTFVLGDFTDVRAVAEVRQRYVSVADADAMLPVSAPDHIAIAGRLANGTVASVFYRGGVSRGDNFRWEINGSKGDLVLTSPVGNLQVINPSLFGAQGDATAVQPLAVPPEYDLAPGAPEGPAANVARLYAAFAQDLAQGTPGALAPDFAHAARLHGWLHAIDEAARSGQAQVTGSESAA